jgi:hypothetical protein
MTAANLGSSKPSSFANQNHYQPSALLQRPPHNLPLCLCLLWQALRQSFIYCTQTSRPEISFELCNRQCASTPTLPLQSEIIFPINSFTTSSTYKSSNKELSAPSRHRMFLLLPYIFTPTVSISARWLTSNRKSFVVLFSPRKLSSKYLPPP